MATQNPWTLAKSWQWIFLHPCISIRESSHLHVSSFFCLPQPVQAVLVFHSPPSRMIKSTNRMHSQEFPSWLLSWSLECAEVEEDFRVQTPLECAEVEDDFRVQTPLPGRPVMLSYLQVLSLLCRPDLAILHCQCATHPHHQVDPRDATTVEVSGG